MHARLTLHGDSREHSRTLATRIRRTMNRLPTCLAGHAAPRNPVPSVPLATVFLMVFLTACGSSPTTPAPVSVAGSWSGTTAHGSPITFTVSADEFVTAISFSHSFNGCSGSQSFSGLHLTIGVDARCIPGPCPPGVSSYRQFSHAATSPAGFSTEIAGMFPSGDRAEGQINLRNYLSCGSAIGVTWQASKR